MNDPLLPEVKPQKKRDFSETLGRVFALWLVIGIMFVVSVLVVRWLF